MSKTFVTAILVGALSLTTMSATPARAASDLEKLLIGATTLIVIGAALKNAERNRQAYAKPKSKPKSKPKPKAKPKPKPKHDVHAHKTHRHHAPAKKVHRQVRAPLPGYCLREVSAHDGNRRIFGAKCLERNYSTAHALPDRCRTLVEGPRGTRVGYRPSCLRNAGFDVRG